ncbi:hypothetical protein [Sphingorhabdus sp. SMR4y]|uniref:hypothetical protein n=1 Tax=Sphingorhabdus sp. SMR4y TaxID=2584094 RepID=UPI000B5C3F79|nr:hypothetical protein [Sphingorhabdus sp. SMR4y]ASK87002.1 hypothetical protein SPHFLASMR4Y_00210 [Sphingorhabdus sp. SMR4y]
MTSENLNISAIQHALANFDLSPEREQIAELLATQDHDREAIERADSKISDLRAEITRLREAQGHDERLTGALRSGDVLDEIETDTPKLRAQIDQLNSSRTKIENDMRERSLQIGAAKDRLRARLSEIGAEAIHTLEIEAIEVIANLASVYADIEVLRHSISARGAANLSLRLSLVLKETWLHWPHVRNKSEQVSPELLTALAAGTEPIVLSGGRIEKSARLPSP